MSRHVNSEDQKLRPIEAHPPGLDELRLVGVPHLGVRTHFLKTGKNKQHSTRKI